MTTPNHPGPVANQADEKNSALFASLVLQQTNLALMFLGHLQPPDGREVPVDVNAAGLFIDTLEMLAAKTRGNLGQSETDFLNQSLTTLRMYFAERVRSTSEGARGPSDSRPPSPIPGTS